MWSAAAACRDGGCGKRACRGRIGIGRIRSRISRISYVIVGYGKNVIGWIVLVGVAAIDRHQMIVDWHLARNERYVFCACVLAHGVEAQASSLALMDRHPALHIGKRKRCGAVAAKGSAQKRK